MLLRNAIYLLRNAIYLLRKCDILLRNAIYTSLCSYTKEIYSLLMRPDRDISHRKVYRCGVYVAIE